MKSNALSAARRVVDYVSMLERTVRRQEREIKALRAALAQQAAQKP